MDNKAIFGSALAITAYVAISAMIRDTQAIWIQTRAFGLLAYAFLFAAVVLGELRVITKGMGEFTAFRYHKGVSVAAVFLVLAHFIAAFADNYKWGPKLQAFQYLGFSFGDQWLAFLSLGTLAFYAMILVGASSSGKMMGRLGCRLWKLIHYFSYAAFMMAYVHSVNLGTDLKSSALAPVLKPIIVLSFIFAASLFATRVARAFNAYSDLWEAGLTTLLVFVTLLSAAHLAALAIGIDGRASALEARMESARAYGAAQEAYVDALYNDTAALSGRVLEANHGTTV
jgi:methionine sulfoxide reductase heme-binding subunit